MDWSRMPRAPIPMVLLVLVALVVLGFLVAQFAIGLVLGVLRLVIIAVAFALIAYLGFYLWHRGDVERSDA